MTGKAMTMPDMVRPVYLNEVERRMGRVPGEGWKEITAFENRMLGKYSGIPDAAKIYNVVCRSHDVMRPFLYFNPIHSDAVYWRRDEFEFYQYGSNIYAVSLILGDNIYLIYNLQCGEWRPGPWWPRLYALLSKWMLEADQYDARARAESERRLAEKKQVADNAFTEYVHRL